MPLKNSTRLARFTGQRPVALNRSTHIFSLTDTLVRPDEIAWSVATAFHANHIFFWSFVCFLAALFIPNAVCAEGVHFPCTVINEYPHDAKTSTQGLFVHEGTLYESSGGYRRSFLATVELKTGRHIRSVPLPGRYFAEGMATQGDHLRLLTWRSGTGFIYRLDTLEKLETFAYRPRFHTMEGWGLAFDGNNFILSSGTDRLTVYTPKEFTPISIIRVTSNGKPVRQLNELEYINGMVYANIWKSDIVIMIDPKTGHAHGQIDLSPLRKRLSPSSGVANGIAYDAHSKRLYVTGKHWNKLFEIALPQF
ncbi:glutaminyl-peptide cyclotransferase [Pseudodesulfovibrio sp. JC047]|uniref:glutaminyl-peptide cyclotransferase n=1 Tax=Pseudodesulfovibrio sp. JC047 TaxID=2683199 RepID=UPI0013D897AA|nr:glutaminyl-peptide cyclotransferase [Pseudodesulfovibrio sp. JC047]NDV18533.1 glutaminyl-peptide cyclotransferase [Pseudodesulfovibrio sp. JC047]